MTDLAAQANRLSWIAWAGSVVCLMLGQCGPAVILFCAFGVMFFAKPD